MTELTPEIRTDKNGKLVTRHVRGSASSKGSLGRVPRVDSGSEDIGTLRKRVARSLATSTFILNDDLDQRDRLVALVDLTSKHDLSASSRSLVNAFVAMDDDDFNKCIGLLERHLDAACAVLSEVASGDVSDAPAIITGLNMFDFEMTTDQERSIVEATCRIWSGDIIKNLSDGAINEMFPNRGEIKSKGTISGGLALRDDLARYIAENPEEIDAVIEMAIKRGISDPKGMEGLGEAISATTAPLLDGIL